MKKVLLSLFAMFVIFSIFIFTGCVKDSKLKPPHSSQTFSRKAPNFGGFILPEENNTKYGTITGIVLPIDAQARVYLLTNTSTIELQLDAQVGSIMKNDIPVGEYSVYVQPENPNYFEYIVDGVVINPDQTTDIGTITLEYYGWGGGGCEIGWGRTKSGK